jgi:hypothetical protein
VGRALSSQLLDVGGVAGGQKNHSRLSRSVLFATIKVKKPRASTILSEAFPHVEAFMRQPFYRYAAVRSQSHLGSASYLNHIVRKLFTRKAPHLDAGGEGRGSLYIYCGWVSVIARGVFSPGRPPCPRRWAVDMPLLFNGIMLVVQVSRWFGPPLVLHTQRMLQQHGMCGTCCATRSISDNRPREFFFPKIANHSLHLISIVTCAAPRACPAL